MRVVADSGGRPLNGAKDCKWGLYGANECRKNDDSDHCQHQDPSSLPSTVCSRWDRCAGCAEGACHAAVESSAPAGTTRAPQPHAPRAQPHAPRAQPALTGGPDNARVAQTDSTSR